MSLLWETPYDWNTGDFITEARLDQIKNNLLFLAGGNYVVKEPANSGNYTTTSAVFVDVDSSEWSADITLSEDATAVRARFMFSFVNTTGSVYTSFEITRDGTPLANTSNGFSYLVSTGGGSLICLEVIDDDITPDSTHTYRLQWRRNGGTATIHATSGDKPLIMLEELH